MMRVKVENLQLLFAHSTRRPKKRFDMSKMFPNSSNNSSGKVLSRFPAKDLQNSACPNKSIMQLYSFG